MRKYGRYLLAAAAVLMLLCLRTEPIAGWTSPEGMSWFRQRSIQKDICNGAALAGGVSDKDAAEQILMEAGIPVMDTEEPYPMYLANNEGLRAFASGETEQFGYFRIKEEGVLRYTAFFREGEDLWFFSTDINCAGEVPSVREMACQPMFEMELAEWDVFYYRLYPAGDPHYIDFTQIFLTPPDRQACDLVYRYIQPVGYQMVNIFLQDWQEGAWEALSFPDLLEALYQMEHGTWLAWEAFPVQGYPVRRMIPGPLFEETILPYFTITREELQGACGYDEAQDSYPWRPVHGNDLTSWGYPMCEPHIMSVRENPDGTLTMEVDIWSPEGKTNRLFSHELTVRPLQEDAFQYVSNRVTYVGDRGLPPAMPRFKLDSP